MSDTDTHGFERRRGGALLHITSLPGPGQRGRLGADAFRFVEWLASAGFTVWQTLPVAPVDRDLSPYQSCSAFAFEPALAAVARVDRDPAAAFSVALRDEDWRDAASEFFKLPAAHPQHSEYETFRHTQAAWLEDYALFMALRNAHAGAPWYEWPAPFRDREAETLRRFSLERKPELDLFRYQQFIVDQQWQSLRSHATKHGVLLFGDVPIFVAHDSADVWAHRQLFLLQADGRMSAVTGVPPDYFSPTGQRWGQPLYDWPRHAADGYRWWIQRIRVQAQRFDLLRLDHFRGFEACWAIDADADTAVNGTWRPGPGNGLFDAMQSALGTLPFVAENLGVITAEVESLRHAYHMPGMSVLQFAFDGNPSNPNLPHNHERVGVTYTGTHDNDTTLGWWQSLPPAARQQLRDYLGQPAEPMPDALIRTAARSVSALAVFPMQDLLELDSAARMNVPGRATGNWRWRFSWQQVETSLARQMRELLTRYGRAS